MFTKEDLGNFKVLSVIINAGKFDLKGDAVIKAASSFVWLKQLEQRAIDEIKEASKPIEMTNLQPLPEAELKKVKKARKKKEKVK